jgi:hypothetical protein
LVFIAVDCILPHLTASGLHQEVTRLYTYQSSACLVDRDSNDDDVKLRCTAAGDANELAVSHASHVYLFLFNDLLLVTKEQEQETVGLFRGVMNKVRSDFSFLSFFFFFFSFLVFFFFFFFVFC